MRWRALALAALLAVPACADVHVVDVAVEPAGVSVAAVGKAGGAPTACPADLDEAALPEGATWFAVLGDPPAGSGGDPDAEPGPPVVARGLLPGASSVVEGEDPRHGDVLARQVTVPLAIVQVRVPWETPPRQLAVYRKEAAGRARVALLPIGGGGSTETKLTEALILGSQTINRVHIQVFAEGFRSRDLAPGGPVELLAEELAEALVEQKPFDGYRHLLAVSLVRAPSANAGVSLEGDPPRRTAFDVTCAHVREDGKLLTDDDGEPLWRWQALEISSQGLDRLMRANISSAPQVRVVVASNPAVSSTPLAGGSPSPVVLTALGFFRPQIVHTLGHALGLGDEYAAAPPRCDRAPAVPAPNLALAGGAVPWQPLIDAGQLSAPSPGGHLCDRTFVHAATECVMRRDKPEAGFCAACRAALVAAFYERVHLADRVEPATRVLAVDASPPGFSVQLAATSRQELRAEWIVGHQAPVPVASPIAGSPPTCALPPTSLGPGHHVVRFLVSDTSPTPVASFPHEVRWDVHVRGAGVTPLVPSGEEF